MKGTKTVIENQGQIQSEDLFAWSFSSSKCEEQLQTESPLALVPSEEQEIPLSDLI